MATPLTEIFLDPTASKRQAVRDSALNYDPATGKWEEWDRSAKSWSLMKPHFGAATFTLGAGEQIALNGVTIDASNNLTVPGTAAVSKTSGDAFTATSGNADAGFNVFTGRNINAGTLAASIVALGNDTYSVVGQLLVGSSAYSGSSGTQLADGFAVRGLRAGGLSLMADAGPIRFIAGGFAASNEKARITTSGNFGIDTDFSGKTFSGNYKFFGLGDNNYYMFRSAASDFYFLNNAYYDGTNYIYATTAQATSYQANGGRHDFLNSASGTAGTAISWTNTMRIANGVVMIGTTTWDTTSTFQVNGSAAFSGGIENTAIGAVTPQSGTFTTVKATGGVIRAEAGVDTNIDIVLDGDRIWSLVNNGGGNLGPTDAFVIRDATANVQRLVIDTIGNIGFNTTTIPAWHTGFKVIEGPIGSVAFGTSDGWGMALTENAYYDTSWKYKAATEAAQISVNNGSITMYVAPAGALANDPITWTKALHINSSANIGFNTTDIEAWKSDLKAIESTDTAIGFGVDTDIHVISNAYFDSTSTWKYKTTDSAANYFMYKGAHTFRVASSGTVDTAITWTNALTIASSGVATFVSTINAVTGVFSGDLKGDALFVNGAVGHSNNPGTIAIANTTEPTINVAGEVFIYAASGECRVMDGSGFKTTLSPHNLSLFKIDGDDPHPYGFFSTDKNGLIVNTYESRLARFADRLWAALETAETVQEIRDAVGPYKEIIKYAQAA